MDELHKGAFPGNYLFARENRKLLTQAEQLLWAHLRNRKLNGFKFRRQHPISNFIADFYCHECALVVELDGGYHNELEQKQYDNGRTYELTELKLKVIRFTNEEVFNDITMVLGKIIEHLHA